MEDIPPPPQPSSVIQDPTSTTQPDSAREGEPGTERTQTSRDEGDKGSVTKVTSEQTIVCEENPVIMETDSKEGEVNTMADGNESGSLKQAEEEGEKSHSWKPEPLKPDSEDQTVEPASAEGTAAPAAAVVGGDEKREEEEERREEKAVVGKVEEGGMEVEPSLNAIEGDGEKFQTSESMETGDVEKAVDKEDVEKAEAKEVVDGNTEG